jgi:hypothetical protein
MGFRCQTISRNTLANANATRPWQIYADFAQHLIGHGTSTVCQEPLGVELDAAVYAFDASTIDLCLSVFAWAPFRSTKAAIKLHTLLDLRGNIPSFIHITDGKTHEVNVMDDPGAGARRVLPDGPGLSGFLPAVCHPRGSSFLRDPRQEQHQVQAALLASGGPDQHAVLCDQTGVLTTHYSSKDYPTTLRRVVVKDDAGKRLVFLTNNFALEARTDCRSVPPALAGGVVLQMDQAASAHQGVLWHQRERRQDADLDCHIHLRADRHHEETPAS